ncbi:hypothetical protein [Nocardia abscessus]|uniref:hypothetical protein n=1 Tax=Nocardia abscessus TaxID=120957 RepID=UPI0024585C56|nr:hypothetical protein [Nocardia abscessus]
MLEFGDGAQDLEEHAPDRSGGVDALVQNHQVHAAVLQRLRQLDQGALASVAIDVLRDVAGGGDAPKYVEDAVISCIFGAGVGVAWKALTPAVKKKVISAVVAVVIGVSPLD